MNNTPTINVKRLEPYVKDVKKTNLTNTNRRNINLIKTGLKIIKNVKRVTNNGTHTNLTNDQKYLVAFAASQVRQGRSKITNWTPQPGYVYVKSSKNSKGQNWISKVGVDRNKTFYIEGASGRKSKLTNMF
tara:strand:+ start:6674 stop:7066 length:393 start_codon:yes stop_codon:yes gene_type:complete